MIDQSPRSAVALCILHPKYAPELSAAGVSHATSKCAHSFILGSQLCLSGSFLCVKSSVQCQMHRRLHCLRQFHPLHVRPRAPKTPLSRAYCQTVAFSLKSPAQQQGEGPTVSQAATKRALGCHLRHQSLRQVHRVASGSGRNRLAGV